jgi:hypothetical protein
MLCIDPAYQCSTGIEQAGQRMRYALRDTMAWKFTSSPFGCSLSDLIMSLLIHLDH